MVLRAMQYCKHIDGIREWYSKEHDNWHKVDGEQSQWLVWEQAQKLALYSAHQIQQYLTRVINGWIIIVLFYTLTIIIIPAYVSVQWSYT